MSTRTHTHGGVDLRLELYPVVGSTTAVLVLPGGGFREHTEHDGSAYAHWLTGIGIGAAVLFYELQPNSFPLALIQARAALDALQRSLLLPGVDPSRVGVVGSSAGGLLAGLLATGAVLSIESEPEIIPRPAFQIQSYGVADLGLLPEPVVASLLGPHAHLARELSPMTHVDARTAASFIWATAQDGPGLPNALAWTKALAEHEVPVELHVYPQGGHGVGLADGRAHGANGGVRLPMTMRWTEHCREWIALTLDGETVSLA